MSGVVLIGCDYRRHRWCPISLSQASDSRHNDSEKDKPYVYKEDKKDIILILFYRQLRKNQLFVLSENELFVILHRLGKLGTIIHSFYLALRCHCWYYGLVDEIGL